MRVSELNWAYGDTRPLTPITLRDGAGVIDLTGAQVTLQLATTPNSDEAAYHATCQVTNPTGGVIRVIPGGSTIPPGRYFARIRAVAPGPQQVSIPNSGHWTVNITKVAN